tara:strand:- start:3293 stop:3961 length:669 start_codon:yes stop_codon:yes gene_type:complete
MDKKQDSLPELISQQEANLKDLLSEQDKSAYKDLMVELRDNYEKDTMFRTEVEMRFSVLDDGRHPTRGSKYWQSVKEQKSHLFGLVDLSFAFRETSVEIRQIQKKLETEEDEFERELLKIDLDRKMWAKRNMEFEGNHRMRELQAWSKIKKELDDGSFNTKNAEGHQLESYQKLYQNKAKTITANTPQGDVFNIHSQLQTVDRIIKEKELGYVKKAELEDKK